MGIERLGIDSGRGILTVLNIFTTELTKVQLMIINNHSINT